MDYIYASNDSTFAGDVLTDILGLHKKCKDQALPSVKVKVFRWKSKVSALFFQEMGCLSNIKNISMIFKVLKTRHVLTDIVIGERYFSDTIFSLLVADKLIFHFV